MTDKEEMYDYVESVAEQNNYYLCPDEELLDDLVEGLVENKKRYGYASCPCRPAGGREEIDNDILCPCEYCDADVNEYGMCYCGLYVSEEVKENPSNLGSIPERRPQEIIDMAMEEKEDLVEEETGSEVKEEEFGVKIWRCEVCGYLCAREMPPPICPICKAKSERFEEFSLT